MKLNFMYGPPFFYFIVRYNEVSKFLYFISAVLMTLFSKSLNANKLVLVLVISFKSSTLIIGFL